MKDKDKKNKANKKNKKKRSLFSKFFSIVFGTVGVFLFVFLIFIFGYNFFIGDNQQKDITGQYSQTKKTSKNIIEKIFPTPKKTKFLILGVDKGEALTDTILVGCFDRDTKKINLISIPRDTYLKMSPQIIKELRALGKHPPNIMKMNAVHSYAGKEHGNEYTKKQIEEFLNIKLDFYITINTEAFRKVIDAVGGIYMDIPKGGLNYDDPYQNLHIHVPAGHQLLNGKMAEGVVRFRSTYRRGDLQRIEMQQQFMKEFFSQVLNKKTILTNATSLLTTFLQEVQTNFGIEDLPKYLNYVKDLNSESISFYTLPGSPKTINGVSYFIQDKEETSKLIDEIFYSSTSSNNKQKIEYKIQILNGSNIDGLAKNKKDLLEKNNFKVIDIGNYTGKKTYDTRIMIKEKDLADDLKKYFLNPKIQIDTTIPDDYNIIIITGLGEKLEKIN